MNISFFSDILISCGPNYKKKYAHEDGSQYEANRALDQKV